MNRASLGSIDSVDAVIHMVDASEKTGLEEQHVISRLNKCGKPIIVGLNKIDITKGKFVPEYINFGKRSAGCR
jgi:GTPase Era involved in 16S rRNA processing